MTKITSPDRIIWLGTSDESLPSEPFPDGSMVVLLDTGQLQIGRSNTWSFVRPLTMTLDIPLGGLPDSVSVPGGSLGATTGARNRQVVALGSSIASEPLPGVETLLIRIEEQLAALLTEARAANIMLHDGLGGVPYFEDLDKIRAGLLTAEETIAR